VHTTFAIYSTHRLITNSRVEIKTVKSM